MRLTMTTPKLPQMFRSKKALNPPDPTDAIIAVILGGVFFFALFVFLSAGEAQAKTAVQEQQSTLANAHALRTYLLTPVTPEMSEEQRVLATELQNSGLRIVDVIRLASASPATEREEELKKLLEAYAPWGKLELVYSDGEVIEIGSVPRGVITVEEILLPTRRPGEVIRARLSTTREPAFYG